MGLMETIENMFSKKNEVGEADMFEGDSNKINSNLNWDKDFKLFGESGGTA